MLRKTALAMIAPLAACGDAEPRAPAEQARDTTQVETPQPVASQVDSEPDAADIAALDLLLAPEVPAASPPAGYRAAIYDLNGDGETEMLVRAEGGGWCGSGGCTFRVYRRTAAGLEKVSGSTLTFLPIGVSPQDSNGWRDLIVSVRGDYVDTGMARLRFDGARYPLNPTTPPAETATELGAIVLSDESTLHPLAG